VQVVQRVTLALTGWLLFFEEKTDEKFGREPWQV
jgi:hypothetical protein